MISWPQVPQGITTDSGRHRKGERERDPEFIEHLLHALSDFSTAALEGSMIFITTSNGRGKGRLQQARHSPLPKLHRLPGWRAHKSLEPVARKVRTHPAHAWRLQSCRLPRKSRRRLWGVGNVMLKNAGTAEGPGRNASSSAAASRKAAARGSGMWPQPGRAMRLPPPRPFRLRSGRPRGGARPGRLRPQEAQPPSSKARRLG